MRAKKAIYYGEYLQLNNLLNLQETESKKYGTEAHDETLFIVVHQVYELWFKQILHEFNSALLVFNKSHIEESELSLINQRLQRIIKIQGLLNDQLSVMETMTPMDFLEFRDLLVPASGFQSTQFREIEIKMGLSTSNRIKIDKEYFLGRLNKEDRERLEEIEKEPNFINLLDSWLSRMPFTFDNEFNFWKEYRTSVEKMLERDENIVQENFATLSEKMKEMQLENLTSTRKTFETLFKQEEHNKLINAGKRTLSLEATLNALFILLYRDMPILNQPYQILTNLMDIDENFTSWRYRHSIMAHRMLGTKIGTGGSSGHQYLKSAADNNRVFMDLFNLSTFLIPRSELPVLPKDIKKQLDFHFSGEK